jgi:RNA polymerase sigma factor (sigma-70 family)
MERQRLFNFIRRRVRTREDAEDILQDVFFQLTDNYDVAEPIERMTAWLYRVARNKIIDWYRKRSSRGTVEDGRGVPGDDGEPASLNLEEILFDPGQNPDEVYARSLVWPALADALEELPEEQREVFALHELEGRSFKEIADITGEPVNTLLSRKRYAVLYLRERLKEMYDELRTI